MQPGKIKDLFKDWVRAGFHFGRGLSDHISARLEASPRGARVGGGIFDVVAGGGLTLFAASSALGTVASVIGAAMAVTSAPLTAVVTAAVGVVWLALATITGGIGLGLLDAARSKAGLARPDTQIVSCLRGMVAKMGAAATSALKFDKKASKDFRKAIDVQPAKTPVAESKPRPDKPADHKL